MTDHVLHDYQHYAAFFGAILVLVIVVGVLLFMRFVRVETVDQLPFLRIVNSAYGWSDTPPAYATASTEDDGVAAHDTIFIVPDISHYTRFIAEEHFTAARSQQIIFSLINAMIKAASTTFELSKLEGDAVLLFADARKYTDAKIGQTIIAIYDAFFEQKCRLMKLDFCSCNSCQHINDLDLKIFVHRGQAARFNFRGSVDHFGADVIILHKLMKNSVKGDRYLMVTEAAADSVKFSGNYASRQVEEDIDHVGKIRATVYTFDNLTTRGIVTCDVDDECPTKKCDGKNVTRSLAS